MELSKRVKDTIRDIHDFPKPGIVFKDITPLLNDSTLCKDIVSHIVGNMRSQKVDAIAGIESRGFLFGLPVAMELGIPFILIRKKGKLPYETISYKYDLEYGSAEIEMHTDSVTDGMNVVVHDDLLATGGTAAAASNLIEKAGGKVSAYSFVVELSFLNGRDKLTNYSGNIFNLVAY